MTGRTPPRRAAEPSPPAAAASSTGAPSLCTAGSSPPLPQRKSSPNKASWLEAAGRRRLPVDTDDPFLAHGRQESGRSSKPPPSSTRVRAYILTSSTHTPLTEPQTPLLIPAPPPRRRRRSV